MYIDGLLYDLRTCIFPTVLGIILLIVRIIFPNIFGEKKKEALIGIIVCLIIGISSIITVTLSIASPVTETYQGEYVDWYRDSNAAHGSGISNAYRFTDGETTRSFNIDAQSKKTVYPQDFIVGEEYIIYYKEGHTRDIIVKVEEVE